MTIGCKTSLVNRSSETFNGTHSRTEVFDIEDKPLGLFRIWQKFVLTSATKFCAFGLIFIIVNGQN